MKTEKLAQALRLMADALCENDCTCECKKENNPQCCQSKKCSCGNCDCDCDCDCHKKECIFDREPDGVQIIVDRPRIENYDSRGKWAKDMSTYRNLIDLAKKCDWETRIPEFIPPHVHENRSDWYDDHDQSIEDIIKKLKSMCPVY